MNCTSTEVAEVVVSVDDFAGFLVRLGGGSKGHDVLLFVFGAREGLLFFFVEGLYRILKRHRGHLENCVRATTTSSA